jgi:hypothetical protein
LLLGIIVSIRIIHVVILPPLVIYWLLLVKPVFTFKAIVEQLLHPRLLVAAIALMVVTVISIVTGEWFWANSTVQISLNSAPRNIWYYLQLPSLGYLAAPFLVPSVVLGALRLHRVNQPFFWAVLMMSLSWLLAFAPFTFGDSRYMLPVLCCYYMLAGLGFSTLLTYKGGNGAPQHVRSIYASTSLVGVALLSLVLVVLILREWPNAVARSHSGMAEELSSQIDEIEKDGSYLLVSFVTRALGPENRSGAFLDLIDLPRESGNSRLAAEAAVRRIKEALTQGTRVYYLFSQFEQRSDLLDSGNQQYSMYFDRLTEEFRLTAMYVSRDYAGREFAWILYSVEASETPGALLGLPSSSIAPAGTLAP